MDLRTELKERGLFYQCTDERFLDLYDQGGERFYCGYDPTADSLHLGHFLTFMAAVNFMKRGNTFYLIVGGATGMIGDPTGKDSARAFLDLDQLRHNEQAISAQVKEILENLKEITQKDFKFEVRNNYDFYQDFSIFDFLRTVGKYITVNTMLSKDSVKKRIDNPEAGMTYTEFSYMLLQGYDFLHLYENEDVKLQIGGSDQWGNMVTGTEMIRKKLGGDKDSYVMTIPLMNDSTGKKFGKSEGNAIWLDKKKNSPYFVYQYFINTSDEDVDKYLRGLTLLEIDQIETIVAQHEQDSSLRYGQKQLASYVTQTLFGKADALQAEKISDFLFGVNDKMELFSHMSASDLDALAHETGGIQLEEEEIRILDLCTKLGVSSSNGEAKKLIQQGSIFIDEEKVDDINFVLKGSSLKEKRALLRKGKKVFKVIRF